MSWHNAPPLNKLTATQLAGNRAAQLWGVDFKGALYTTYQRSQTGTWSDWRGTAWHDGRAPEQIYELAAAQMDDGKGRLWVLDMKRQLWSIAQNHEGDWGEWEANWHKPPGKVGIKKISAARFAINHRTQLWAINDDGMLLSCYLAVPSGVSAWQDFPKTKDGLPWIEISACPQTNGRGALWGIDNKMQLWGMGMRDNGEWPDFWVGPNWLKAPKVRNIAAVEMANGKGASIWAITDDYKIIYNLERARDEWWGWSSGDFEGTLRGYEITAAVQNKKLGRVWVVDMDQTLTSQRNPLGSPPYWDSI